MTDIISIPLAIPRGEVLDRLGYPAGGELRAGLGRLIDSLLSSARGLVSGRGSALVLPPDRAIEVGLAPREAAAFVLGVVTIGPDLEARVRELTARGETASAVVLDAAGSVAASEAAEQLCAIVTASLQVPVRTVGAECPAGWRYPGCGGWTLDSQRAVLDLLPAKALGIELNHAMMMIPRKSLSFARWLGQSESMAEPECAVCHDEWCAFRRGTAAVAHTEER